MYPFVYFPRGFLWCKFHALVVDNSSVNLFVCYVYLFLFFFFSFSFSKRREIIIGAKRRARIENNIWQRSVLQSLYKLYDTTNRRRVHHVLFPSAKTNTLVPSYLIFDTKKERRNSRTNQLVDDDDDKETRTLTEIQIFITDFSCNVLRFICHDLETITIRMLNLTNLHARNRTVLIRCLYKANNPSLYRSARLKWHIVYPARNALSIPLIWCQWRSTDVRVPLLNHR